MKIGIDFDNTIACYDTLFHEVALRENFISKSWSGCGKTELRNYLRTQLNGEKTWMRLQGLVYGKYMHLAKLMPNVANFLLSCNVRNHELFIISHKTEYGHYDLERISLRKEALKWMKSNRFFDPEYFGVDKKNVFFAETREEKVEKIAHLKCNWFIDDLPDVFKENHFPSDTKKILFGSYESELIHNTTILHSWRKISEKILGQITNKDIMMWTKQMVDKPLKEIKKIQGRGNSSIYKVMASNKKSYALKYYPDQILDKRTRLKTEFGTLRLLHQENITNVPKAVEKDEDLSLGLYEWINGDNFGEPSVNNFNQVIDFVGQLYLLSKKIDGSNVTKASEACLSANELVKQVENRLLRLKQESKHFQELSKFLGQTFEPLWAVAKDESISRWPLESRDKALSKDKQTLSPSDLGFHNCLKGIDGSFTFIDFDYFGWDDPVKLTADFLWHPGMNLSTDLKGRWKNAMLDLFSDDHQFDNRLTATMPLYGLRWALIILNEFLPGFADRRKEAGESKSYEIKKVREIQLKKAKHYCSNVKTMISQITLA